MKHTYFIPNFLDSVEPGDELDESLAYVYGRFEVASESHFSDLSLQLNDNQNPAEKVYIQFNEGEEAVAAVGIKPGVYRIPYILLSKSSMTGMLGEGEYSRIWVQEECFSGWFQVRPGDLVYLGDFYGVFQGGREAALRGYGYNFEWTTTDLIRDNPALQTMRPRVAWDEQGMRSCLAMKSGAMPSQPSAPGQGGYQQVPTEPEVAPSPPPTSNYRRVDPPQNTPPAPSMSPPPPPAPAPATLPE